MKERKKIAQKEEKRVGWHKIALKCFLLQVESMAVLEHYVNHELLQIPVGRHLFSDIAAVRLHFDNSMLFGTMWSEISDI